MIIFSWTLTPNQILALRDIADFHHSYEQAAAKKQFRGNGHGIDRNNLRHWIGASRHLIKEGFAVHKEVPWESWEKKYNPPGNRQCWEITTKGLLVLQMVEIEVRQQAEMLKLDSRELKLLQATAA